MVTRLFSSPQLYPLLNLKEEDESSYSVLFVFFVLPVPFSSICLSLPAAAINSVGKLIYDRNSAFFRRKLRLGLELTTRSRKRTRWKRESADKVSWDIDTDIYNWFGTMTILTPLTGRKSK